MKKVITICLLVITLLAGVMTIEAKTTKKKSNSKSRTTQTSSSKELPKFEDFYIWGYSDDFEKNMYLIQPNLKILINNLSKYDYHYKGNKFLSHDGDYYRFTRNGGPEILVTDNYASMGDIQIIFNRLNELEKYWEYLKSIGFKEDENNRTEGERGIYYYSISKDGINASYWTNGENAIVFTSDRY